MNNFSEIKRPNSNFNQSGNLIPDRIKIEPQKFQSPRQSIERFSKSKGILFFSGCLVIAVVALIIMYFAGVFKSYDLDESKGEWQAIFLTNGEVYFGKVARVNKEVVMMQNIFYLQNKEALQQGALTKTQTGDVALIKLGNELHGPMDEMRVNRNQVLFIEDMKAESKIVKAIMDYIKK